MTQALSFGEWLRSRRRLLDLTQAELANQVGCSPVTIRKLEIDERRPSKQLVDRLAHCLAIPPEEQAHFLAFARATPPLPPEAPPQRDRFVEPGLTLPAPPQTRSVDWGEAPDVSRFYGRAGEVTQLRQWLVDDGCRLVTLLGMGGMGKTALATKVASQVEPAFAAVVWCSLRNAPPVEELLGQCLQVVSNEQAHLLPNGTEKRIKRLLEYLRRQRCLIVLDNFETILHGEQAGHYLPGYEGYGYLLQQVGEGRHQSCLLLTSREKPQELVALEGDKTPVRTLALTSLSPKASRALLQGKNLAGSHQDWRALHARYSGNPLALQVVAEAIRELFMGDIGKFLCAETTIFGSIADLLAQQFTRLSPLEQELLLWLAVAREPVEPEVLRADLVQLVSKVAVLEALHVLRQRSLVERTALGFTLQNVFLEYLTAHLIAQVCAELRSGQLFLFQRHTLFKAQAKGYVRESQRTLLLAPIAHGLLDTWGQQECAERLQVLLAQLPHHQRGYAAGNLLNLLVYLNTSLQGLNFSQLAVWQADLRGVIAQDVNFYQADLATSMFTESFGALEAVALSSDGQYLAGGAGTGDIRLWRAYDGQPLLTCLGHTGLIRSLRFSRDGRLLASASFDQTVRLWEVQSGACLQTLVGHTSEVWWACFSPGDNVLASAAADQTIRLWDVRSGQCLRTLQGHTGWVTTACFNPDGRLLASGSTDQTVRLWDVQSGACLRTFQGHRGEVRSVCFSPDGRLLASSSTAPIMRLWDVQSGACLRTFQGHRGEVRSVYFSPDGQTLISASFDQTIRLWDVQTGQCHRMLTGHTAAILAINLSSNGRLLASAGYDQTLRLWTLPSGQSLHTIQGHSGVIWSICFHPTRASLASGSFDALVRLWDVGNGQCLHTLQGHTGWVTSVYFSPDGHMLASGGYDQTIRLWNMHDGQCLRTLRGHTDIIWSVCISSDGRLLASSSEDREVRLWEVHSGACLHTFQGHQGAVRSVCISPDGRLLASCSTDQSVRLWDIPSRRCLAIFPNLTDTYSICFSPDGRLLASSHTDHTIRLWEVSTGQCLHILRGHIGWVTSVCFSPDGATLVSGSADQTVRWWDVQSGQCFSLLQTEGYLSVRISPDGQLLAGGSADHTILVRDLRTQECLRVLRGDRPYERMNITGVTGLTPTQVATLKALGAVEEPNK